MQDVLAVLEQTGEGMQFFAPSIWYLPLNHKVLCGQLKSDQVLSKVCD